MRIAIVTLPLMANYGGILQNYALQTVLKRMGHEVETLSLLWKLKLPLWKLPLSLGKRFIRKYILRHPDVCIFYEKKFNRILSSLLRNMERFVSVNIATRPVKSFSKINPSDYDAFVVGSDQIWRPCYSYKPISDVYLSFAKEWKGIKRVAYAASFGTDKWEYTPEQTEQCAALAALFDRVSVREESAVRLCREYLHCSALHVLDPTMLLTAADYIRLFEDKPLEAPRGQLLTYVLDETAEKAQIIRKVADECHYRTYRANSRYEDWTAPLDERVQPPVEQWLKDFYEARFVITDSFHATVFSILFGKPFIVIGNRERGLSRIESLWKMFGLESHVVHTAADVRPAQDYAFDAKRINERLQPLREESMDYLRKALQ